MTSPRPRKESYIGQFRVKAVHWAYDNLEDFMDYEDFNCLVDQIEALKERLV